MTRIYKLDPYPGAEELDSTPVEELETQRFTIKGPDSANWALGRLARVEAAVEEIERQAEEARKALEARRLACIGSLARERVFFEGILTEYAMNHRNEILGGGKKKSHDYINGRIGYRTRKAKLVIEDAAALSEWLATMPPEEGLYRVVIEPQKKSLDEWSARTGTTPPGCRFEAESESVEIKPVGLPTLEE